MQDVESDNFKQLYDHEKPSSKEKPYQSYHQALTAHLLRPTRVTGSAPLAEDNAVEDTDPVRALLTSMRRAANQYLSAPIAARFAEINRKR